MHLATITFYFLITGYKEENDDLIAWWLTTLWINNTAENGRVKSVSDVMNEANC